MMPQSHAIRRGPRVQLPHTTPAVLRPKDGSRRQGELKTISLSGGLVCLPKPLDRSSRVNLVFVTHGGAIRGSAEMLKPVSGDLQPFRFVALDEGDQRKLRAAIRLYLSQNSVEETETYRDKLVYGTFFGDLLGYNADGDDLLGVNLNPEQNCPTCGIAGHNHTLSMTKECARKLLCGDDQTGRASEPKSISNRKTRLKNILTPSSASSVILPHR
jgi:hypothetical protein